MSWYAPAGPVTLGRPDDADHRTGGMGRPSPPSAVSVPRPTIELNVTQVYDMAADIGELRPHDPRTFHLEGQNH